MKMGKVFIGLLLMLISKVAFSQDAEGCKEHPMFPNRMSNYLISECTNNFNATEFWISPDASRTVTKEGTTTSIRYDFNSESGQQKPSALQILRNYENAAKKIGGTTMYFNVGSATGVFKIVKNGKEVAWVKVESGGNDSNDFISLTIVELEAMNQEITSNDILTALNTDGRIALYINFETGKSDIKPESQAVIDQIAEMLKSNPALKISIEGHTDNVGTPTTNKTLSENRANAVKNALITKGTDKSRLSSKGFGQDNPISENNTEDGKAKNRRVEIVKI
jgi:OOP family OmpA-OmpF porin